MDLKIVSPQDIIFTGEVDFVVLPGSEGELGILSHHAPLLSTLREGKITLREKEGTKSFDISGGFAEVLNNKVSVLVS